MLQGLAHPLGEGKALQILVAVGTRRGADHCCGDGRCEPQALLVGKCLRGCGGRRGTGPGLGGLLGESHCCRDHVRSSRLLCDGGRSQQEQGGRCYAISAAGTLVDFGHLSLSLSGSSY